MPLHLNLKNKHKYAFWIMPILVYLTVFGCAQLIALAGNCHGWWEVCWSRCDSGLYIEISKIGHTLIPCNADNGYAIGSGKWCGNAGWAPFYPFLIYLFNFISGIPSNVCGLLLSHLFFIAFLYMVASISALHSFSFSNLLTLFLCALCPGCIYLYSLYPLSLLVLLISIIFWCIQNNKYRYALLPAYLIALTYSSAIIIFFCMGVYCIYLWKTNRTHKKLTLFYVDLVEQWKAKRPFRLIITYILIPGLCGMLSLYFYDWMVTGHWNAMYMVQNKYGHLLYSPFKNLGQHFGLFQAHLFRPEAWIDFHNIFFFFAVPVLIYILTKIKNALTPLLIIYTLIMWYIPYSIGVNVSLYRSIVLLAPVFAFMHPLKNIHKIVLLIIAAIFYYAMGVLFILSKLP